MLYQMCEMQLPGCTLPISGETFFVDGSIWNAGNTGLSGQRDRILLRTWNDHLYQLFFPGIKVFMRRKSQPACCSVICRIYFRFYFCERLTKAVGSFIAVGNAQYLFCTLLISVVDGMKSVIRNLRTKSFLERRDFMVYERLGIKKVWDWKKEYRSEKNPEKKEEKSGRYTEILQIFHMTVMILGIFMEKISRVQAMGGKRAGIIAAYEAAGKGRWISRNKVR